MPMNEGFDPDYPLPLFLDDQSEQQRIGKARDGAVISWRIFKASLLIAAATAIGISALAVGNPVPLLADVTASLVDRWAPQSGSDQSTPTMPSIADAQALPPEKDAPTSGEIAAAEPAGSEPTSSEPAGQKQAENSAPSSDALFMQFQAWAAAKDGRAQVEPTRPVQDAPPQIQIMQDAKNAPAPAAENARVPVRLAQKRRYIRPIHNARAEMPRQNPRENVRPAQNARGQVQPAPGTRPQDQPAQTAEPPSFLQSFGLRN
jgi:hypothetical protein